MSDPIDTQNVLGRIAALVTDPRSRQGRVYPLVAIQGMLLCHLSIMRASPCGGLPCPERGIYPEL